MSQSVLEHPTLECKLRGNPSKSTIEFRNIKYASIPARWQDSILNNSLRCDSKNTYDATQLGPSCPHHRGAQAWDVALVGNVPIPFRDGHLRGGEWMDEFECLNLNVIVPRSVLDEKRAGKMKALPVFVWVHGGGLSMGSNAWPQYNISKFVERSVEIGKPVIGVSFNYRVGILGFLASKELGINGNFGFKDQILAFRWIRKHIAGFGGDPNDITAAGESAGGISLSTLLCAEVEDEGLFERVVIMSGEATLRKPRSGTWHEKMYQEQLKFIGLDELSVADRRERLRESSAEELISKLPLAQHYCACIDGKFLKEDVTLGVMSDGKRKQHKPNWCKQFVVGDTAHDGTILKSRILDDPHVFSSLRSLCNQLLTPAETTSLLSAYNLPASSPEQDKYNLLQLASDLRFHFPALAVYSGWKASSSPRYCRRYHFHVPNPIEGSFRGLTSHELDVAFLFGNFDAHVPQESKEVGQQMRDQWIAFACGEGWCEGGKVVVIGQAGVTEVDEAEYDRDFRNGRGKILEDIGADRIWRLAEGWQGVRADEDSHTLKAKM